MGFTKQEAKMTKGLAILFMVILHLFQRLDNLPYTPLLHIGNIPFIYYLGLLADATVPMYCFCMGYSHYLSAKKDDHGFFKSNLKRLLSFMINYWIIVILISIAGFAVGSYPIPKTPLIFLGNFFTIITTYNGAWWFVKTYIMFVFLSPILYRLSKKCHYMILLPIMFVLYTGAYIVRFGDFPASDIIHWFLDLISRFGTSLFPYIIGMVFCKHDVFTKIKEKIKVNKIVSFLIFMIIFVGCLIGHIMLKPLYFSVFFATAIIIAFNFWQKPRIIIAIFSFLGEHSTNIWLTHMFFYLYPFDNFVFTAKYPILILLLMLAVTVACSYLLKLINKPFGKLLSKPKNSQNSH